MFNRFGFGIENWWQWVSESDLRKQTWISGSANVNRILGHCKWKTCVWWLILLHYPPSWFSSCRWTILRFPLQFSRSGPSLETYFSFLNGTKLKSARGRAGWPSRLGVIRATPWTKLNGAYYVMPIYDQISTLFQVWGKICSETHKFPKLWCLPLIKSLASCHGSRHQIQVFVNMVSVNSRHEKKSNNSSNLQISGDSVNWI